MKLSMMIFTLSTEKCRISNSIVSIRCLKPFKHLCDSLLKISGFICTIELAFKADGPGLGLFHLNIKSQTHKSFRRLTPGANHIKILKLSSYSTLIF